MYVLQDVQCISGLGIVVFYVTDVFTVPKCQVWTGLAYVGPVACFTCQVVYAAFVVVHDKSDQTTLEGSSCISM